MFEIVTLLLLACYRLIGQLVVPNGLIVTNEYYTMATEYVKKYMSMEQCLSVFGYMLCYTYFYSWFYLKLRKVANIFILRLVYLLARFCQVIIIMAIYVMLPQPSGISQQVGFAAFVIIMIFYFMMVLFKVVYGIMIFMKTRSIAAALFGSPVLIVDYVPIPVKHNPGVIAFNRVSEGNVTRFWYGEYSFQGKPSMVKYYSRKHTVVYSYSSSFKLGADDVYVYQQKSRQDV
nr:MAG: membrane protein 1 [Bovine nidovirus 1]